MKKEMEQKETRRELLDEIKTDNKRKVEKLKNETRQEVQTED